MKIQAHIPLFTTVVLLVTTALSACTPADQPAESVPADTTTASTSASTTATVTTPATVIPTEPVTTPTETTPITEEVETKATEETFAVPEGASPMPDLNADNVFIIPTMEEVLEEFDDIQTESDTLEENLVKLMKRNVVCFDMFISGNIYGAATFEVNYQEYQDNGMAIVKSDFFLSYSQLINFTNSTYSYEAVQKWLGYKRFLDIDDTIYITQNGMYSSLPFINNTILEIVSITEKTISCRYYINITDPFIPYYINGIIQQQYMVKEFDIIMEDGRWNLPDIIYDNSAYVIGNGAYTDEIV